MLETLISLDKKLLFFFNNTISNPIFDIFFPLITNPRTWIIPILVGLFFFYRKEKKKAILLIILSLITIAIVDPLGARVLKPLFGRLRPCHPNVLIDGINFLLGQKRSFSFPSNHALNVFAIAALYTYYYKNHWKYFFIFATLIGFSRIYTGVHYPLDILGGAAIGSAIGLLVAIVGKKIVSKFELSSV